MTSADFHWDGIRLDWRERLKTEQRLCVICWLHSFKRRTGRPSVPLALDVSRFFKQLATSHLLSSVSRSWDSTSNWDEKKMEAWHWLGLAAWFLKLEAWFFYIKSVDTACHAIQLRLFINRLYALWAIATPHNEIIEYLLRPYIKPPGQVRAEPRAWGASLVSVLFNVRNGLLLTSDTDGLSCANFDRFHCELRSERSRATRVNVSASISFVCSRCVFSYLYFNVYHASTFSIPKLYKPVGNLVN